MRRPTVGVTIEIAKHICTLIVWRGIYAGISYAYSARKAMR